MTGTRIDSYPRCIEPYCLQIGEHQRNVSAYAVLVHGIRSLLEVWVNGVGR